ncbi:hypothetical protein [Noviherbaspirillum sp. UKPF54]|uniref:hypothetical protein n=1 Tax=Noviherbaspirillum sp. UKPF54 TaxID=2601898 RepID=UPI0011B112CF|nr:hypothetical protein [Noviherbaspirillum sp. UKPF54]QDZ30116.1 hypothetical protein FAY22_20425 [Noviherbaspirillum sp. UKPF54]
MKTQDMNYSHLPTGIRNDGITALERAHRDAALDEALRESFPASDPIAVSFTSPYAPDMATVPNRDSQIENEKRQMAELGVTYDGRSYRYKEYRYDLLSDALNYARLEHSSSSYLEEQEEAPAPPQWIEPDKPTEADKRMMEKLAITFDGKYYRYHDYRYDHLVDAIHYAQQTRSSGAM